MFMRHINDQFYYEDTKIVFKNMLNTQGELNFVEVILTKDITYTLIYNTDSCIIVSNKIWREIIDDNIGMKEIYLGIAGKWLLRFDKESKLVPLEELKLLLKVLEKQKCYESTIVKRHLDMRYLK